MRVAVGIVVALALGAGPASAQAPGGGTAPAYPGNTLTLSVPGPIVAGTVVKAHMSGHADWGGPTDNLTIPYDLALSVHNADIVPQCGQSYGAELQMNINVRVNASTSISNFVVDSNQNISPTPPNAGLDWSGDSLPFSIQPGLDHVLLCGYVRYVTDDVAWYQLPVTVKQPACTAVRSTVRRGSKLELKCNVSGPATVRFTGPRTRTVAVKIPSSNGRVKVSTTSLKRGRYRVTVRSNGLQLGAPMRVRVR